MFGFSTIWNGRRWAPGHYMTGSIGRPQSVPQLRRNKILTSKQWQEGVMMAGFRRSKLCLHKDTIRVLRPGVLVEVAGASVLSHCFDATCLDDEFPGRTGSCGCPTPWVPTAVTQRDCISAGGGEICETQACTHVPTDCYCP